MMAIRDVWIVTAHDPVPGVDDDIRVLRYGELALALCSAGRSVRFWTSSFCHWRKQQRGGSANSLQAAKNMVAEVLPACSYESNVSLSRIKHNRQLAAGFKARARVLPPPDLIIAAIPCLELAEAAAEFASRCRVLFVSDIQDIWPDVYLTYFPRVMRPLARALLVTEYARLRRILAMSSCVTAVSKAYLDWTEPHAKPGKTVAMFPLGYSLPSPLLHEAAVRALPSFEVKHGISEGDIVVSFVGQLATSYDVLTIARAARVLGSGASLPPYKIVLAGNGYKESALRKECDGLSNIVLTGWLERVDTITLLERSDVALASYTCSAAQSLPYKPFEYMAYGLPIINSLPGELADLIDRYRLGVNYVAGDVTSLAAAIRTLILDDGFRSEAGSNARRRFDHEFDAHRIYESFSRYLIEMSGSTPAEIR